MTVVCLATGPSLAVEDVDYCRDKATVLAVNDAWTLAPWASTLFSSDRYWWEFYRGVPEFSGRKVGIEHTPGRRHRPLAKWPIEIMRNTGHEGIETAPDGLRTCANNSGGAAVNLAVHLGAQKICLLGYDMNDAHGNHFFGDHPPGLSNAHNFPTWRKAFRTMVEPLKALGIEVVNCSRSTSLDCWPLMPLEEAL